MCFFLSETGMHKQGNIITFLIRARLQQPNISFFMHFIQKKTHYQNNIITIFQVKFSRVCMVSSVIISYCKLRKSCSYVLIKFNLMQTLHIISRAIRSSEVNYCTLLKYQIEQK